ncbi:hypothetical protein CP532_6040 [Ophiocordyceps camponoti-leonardi (nom. inval.)]|nr:hypothetical protein CP532_6040 [Ophiocordyceps camponoti-leonardi (nom. inval.)]
MAITTELTRRLGIRVPVVQGGMMHVGTADLAAAVSNAGGLGIITALIFPSADALRQEIRRCRTLTRNPFAVNLTLLPSMVPPDYGSYAKAVVDEGIRIVETAGNSPGPIIAQLKKEGVTVLHKCTTIRHAQSAVKLGVDFLSIDGFECAGHVGESDITNFILLSRARQSLGGVPFIASGGFADGWGLAAALCLGACGVNMGTRFMCTVEAPIHQRIKDQIVSADETDTVLLLRRWRNTSRLYKNTVALEALRIERESQKGEFAEVAPLVSGKRGREVFVNGDPDHGVWTAGQVIGLIHDIPTCDVLASLTNLPDHLLADIIDHFDTACDVSSFGQSSRRLYSFICHGGGWRSFAYKRFPTLMSSAPDMGLPWSAVVDRLTYLDRCWDTRALLFTSFREDQNVRRGRRKRGEQSVDFQVLVSARAQPFSPHEMLVYSAGEKLHVRQRHILGPVGGRRHDSWCTLSGFYQPGPGDVTALSLIERDSNLEIIVGRADGSVRLIAAGNGSVGRPLSHLLPGHPLANSPGRLAVMWTEWHPRTGLVASCRDSFLTLHDLSKIENRCGGYESTLAPVAHFDATPADHHDGCDVPYVRCAKFFGSDGIACGVSGSSRPLRWGKIRPTGLQLTCSTADRPYSKQDSKQTVMALEQVGGQAHENLLLGAWSDGSYRLLDLRTPLEHDAIYRDRHQPHNAGASLLVYGMERFVAGSHSEPVLRLFDFRNPKPYYQTTAKRCESELLAPGYCRTLDDLDKKRHAALGREAPARVLECEPGRDRVCVWHDLARKHNWRPDASVFLGSSRHDRVASLAKASDLSDAFYCGLRGAMVEAVLHCDVDADGKKPLYADPRSPPRGCVAKASEGGIRRVSLLETGVARRSAGSWTETPPTYLPRATLYACDDVPPGSGNPYGGKNQWQQRLSGRWYELERVPRRGF